MDDRQSVQIPWGSEKMQLQLPSHWNIIGNLEPTSLSPVGDVKAEISRALVEPIGEKPLHRMDLKGKKVTIVIDDISRPTPVPDIFPLVLTELLAGGAEHGLMTIVPALGLHRGMEEEEIRHRIGMSHLEGIQWENPDADDQNKQVFLGTTSFGTPVWLNFRVAQADLIVSIGCIEPHIIASFGGGYKNLLPGVAGRISISKNHALNCHPQTFNMVGQPIQNNPMRQDLEEAGKMLPGQVFIVNAILDNHQQLVQVVAGDPILAHRAGVETSSKLYGVRIPRQADIVITCSHPMNSDLRQGVKALANTVRALKPGGTLLTLIKAEEGVGVFGLANKKFPVGKDALKMLAPVILPMVTRLKIEGLGEEDRFFLYFAIQAMRMGNMLIYGPTIPTEVQSNLVFVDFVPTPEAGIQFASQHTGKQPDVLIFPNGGITYPIL